jgi:hypothetical protein
LLDVEAPSISTSRPTVGLTHRKGKRRNTRNRRFLFGFHVFTAMTMKNAVFWDVLTGSTGCHISEDGILRSHYCPPYTTPIVANFGSTNGNK